RTGALVAARDRCEQVVQAARRLVHVARGAISPIGSPVPPPSTLGHAHTCLFVAGAKPVRCRTEPRPALLRITSVTLAQRVPVRGLIAGLLSGAVGVCVAFLVSGLTGEVGSPVVAVGQLAIDLSPPPVKNFAIREFGTHDKLVLQVGVIVVLAVFAAAIGVLAQRRETTGLIGVAIFGVVGLVAAGTRPTATAADLLPTLAGSAAAAVVLVRLIRAAGPARTSRSLAVPSTEPEQA